MELPELQAGIERWRRRLGDPAAGHAYVRLADLLLKAGRRDDALRILEEGLEQGPVSPGALLLLGKLLLDRGRDIEGRSHLLRLLSDDPGNTRALVVLADQARIAGRWEEAVRLYERLVALEPAVTAWAELLQEVRAGANARPRPDALAEGAGRQPMPTMTLVDIYLAQGYRDRALDALRRMQAMAPERQDIKRKLAEIQGDLALGIQPVTGTEAAGPGGAGPGDPATLAAVREDAARRRENEKQMFRSWVRTLRDGADP